MVIRTERYLKHVILYFIYVLSPIYNFTFLILCSRVSKITAIIFSIIFLTSIFFDIFTFFLNFKIKRVFSHKIILEEEYMKVYDTFPKIGIKIPKEQVIYYADIQICEIGKKTYCRKIINYYIFHFI